MSTSESLDRFTLFNYAQIDQQREGEQIDRALLKNVLDISVEIGMGKMECYDRDFEDALLKDTSAYYSRKASNWILEDSCPDYMLKVIQSCFYVILHIFLVLVLVGLMHCLVLQAEECLKREKDRVSHYLHSGSEQKLLEVCNGRILLLLYQIALFL